MKFNRLTIVALALLAGYGMPVALPVCAEGPARTVAPDDTPASATVMPSSQQGSPQGPPPGDPLGPTCTRRSERTTRY